MRALGATGLKQHRACDQAARFAVAFLLSLLADFLDRDIFEGARFADVLRRGSRPLVVIGATDLSQGSRFEFVQDTFDALCSDLGSVKLGAAVAALAAVPIALSPITLRNHVAPCPPAGSTDLYRLFGNRQLAELTRQAMSYFDKAARPYVHLLDGGLSDNLAARGPLRWSQAQHVRRSMPGAVLHQ